MEGCLELDIRWVGNSKRYWKGVGTCIRIFCSRHPIARPWRPALSLCTFPTSPFLAAEKNNLTPPYFAGRFHLGGLPIYRIWLLPVNSIGY